MSRAQFQVNPSSPIPVYVQIENLIQFAIAAETYKAGELLPSVRDLSGMLGVNANTVTKVYRDLELMGLVHPRRGVGVSVSADAPRICRERGRGLAKSHLRDAVAECTASGVPVEEIHRIVAATIASGERPYITE